MNPIQIPLDCITEPAPMPTLDPRPMPALPPAAPAPAAAPVAPLPAQ